LISYFKPDYKVSEDEDQDTPKSQTQEQEQEHDDPDHPSDILHPPAPLMMALSTPPLFALINEINYS
jgi:hypothetical protein